MRYQTEETRTLSKVTASVVLYKHSANEVRPLFESLARQSALSAWVVVNNGGAEDACSVARSMGGRVIHSGNIGYGRGNNLAAREIMHEGQYHLFVNPDVRFESGVLGELCTFMDRHPDIGQVMPQILYEDGSHQRLCKLLPTPFDLFMRRFLRDAGRGIFRSRRNAYEMRNVDLSIAREVPSLSGCFMFVRTAVLEEIGLFDEQYFMYLEDVDLCRRIGACYRTAFYPYVSIFHGYSMGSYRRGRLLRLHIQSAIKYFNKWGWFHDPERERLNARITPIDD